MFLVKKVLYFTILFILLTVKE